MKPNKDTIYRNVCLVVLAIAILVVAVTLAFFTSTDTVTNRLRGDNIAIELVEPRWVASGSTLARTLEPGMTIEKDPQVKNICTSDVCIRLKITIYDESGNEITLETDDGNVADSRLQHILAAIYIAVDDADDIPLYSPEASADKDAYAYTSLGGNYYYYNGWFYYVEASETFELAILSAGSTAPALFSYIKVPIYNATVVDDETVSESDAWYIYDGYFDTPFTIVVTAQAVRASTLEGVTDVEGVASIFDSEHVETDDSP